MLRGMAEPLDRHEVPGTAPRLRLDRYAASVFERLPSTAAARKAIKRGEVLLNGEACETSRFVVPGDTLDLLPDSRNLRPAYEIELEVPWQDEHLAVVVKPPGIPVSGNRHRTLEHALPHNLGPSTAPDALPVPGPVHRLDARTGGLVVVARAAGARAALGRMFQQRQVHKRYRALLLGRLEGEGEVHEPLEGREAITRYRAVHHARSLRTNWLTTVELWPVTGRTHQLRRHAAHLGHPVLGDGVYGIPGQVLKHQGLFLWALQVDLPHPVSGEPLCARIDEPAKFESHRAREQRRWERWTAQHPEEA